MQTSIRSTTDSTQHGDLPRTENDGGNSWKRLYARNAPAWGLPVMNDDDDENDSNYKYNQLFSGSNGRIIIMSIAGYLPKNRSSVPLFLFNE